MCLSFLSMLASIFTMFVLSSKTLIGYDLSIISNTSCVLVSFFRRVIREAPCWVDVLITIDRYLLICYNNKIQFMTKRKNLIFILLLILVVLIVKSVETFYYQLNYTFKVVNGSNTSSQIVSTISCTSSKANLLLTNMLTALFRSIIPSIIMIVLSWFLVKKVHEKQNNMKKIHQNFNHTNSEKKGNKKETIFTACIISMNTLFVLLNFPYAIMNVYKTICLNYIQIQDPLTVSIVKNVYTLAFDLANLYYSTMFFSFIYFNKLFYKEILIVFGLKTAKIAQSSLKSS
jgi:hypothetical protein